MGVLRVVDSYAYSEKNGVQRVLRAGDVIDDDDPAVKGRPKEWFEKVEVSAQRVTQRAVEQATAAPGEKRAASKPEE